MDLVPVALGVGEALEGHHAHALTDDRAVRALRERPAVAGRGERRRLRETHVHHHVVERVDAAGQHHIRLVQIQPVQRRLQRGKRTGAGGVGDEVGPAEVEAVGDATGDDVAEQTRERTLLPRHIVIGDVLTDLVGFAFGQPVLQQRFTPDRPLHPGTHLNHELGRRGDPEYHVHAIKVDLGPAALHLVEQLLGCHQSQDLSGVRRR